MIKKSRRKKRPTKSFALSFFLLFALLILYPAGPAAAQEHFVLDLYVGGGFYYTDNLYFADSEEESEFYNLDQIGANLTIPLYSRNFNMGLGYQLSAYFFTSTSEFETLHDFSINVGFGKDFTKKPGFLRDLTVSIGDKIDTVTRTVRSYGERDPFNLVQRNQLEIMPVYKHSFSRQLKLVGEYQLQRVDYFGSDTNSFFGNDLSASLRRIMNRAITLYGALDVMYRMFDEPEKFTYVGDYMGFQARIGMDLTVRRLTFGVFGGYAMYMIDGESEEIDVKFWDVPDPVTYTVEAEDQSSPIFMIKVNYLLTRMIELNASFNRYFRVDVVGEVLPTMMGRFQVIAKISKRLVLEGDASYQMYDEIKSTPVSYLHWDPNDLDDDEVKEIWLGGDDPPEDVYDIIKYGDTNILSFGLGGSYEFYPGLLIKAEFKFQQHDGNINEITYFDPEAEEGFREISLGGEGYSRMFFGVKVQYNFKTIRFIL